MCRAGAKPAHVAWGRRDRIWDRRSRGLRAGGDAGVTVESAEVLSMRGVSANVYLAEVVSWALPGCAGADCRSVLLESTRRGSDGATPRDG